MSSRSSDAYQSNTTYFIDAENAAEMARLTKQDRLVTKAMNGLFPEGLDLSNIHNVLDIACGPGGWVLDVASTYRETKVVGVDISQLMVEYANAQARTQELHNASFRVMNVLHPLDFPDNSFGLVNARFLFGFMPPTAWPQLMQECLRITRPGGIIRLTEVETAITNSPAHEKLGELITKALYATGQSFSPNGQSNGITPMLGRFLRDIGCLNIQKKATIIDYSADTEIHPDFYQNQMVVFKLLQPFIVKAGIITQEEIDRIYQQMLAEMRSDAFYGLWFQLSAWGEKPY